MRVVARSFLLFVAFCGSAFAAAEPIPTYLREHASDRVQWQPWDRSSFARAEAQNKPIALAVGSFAPHAVRMQQMALNADAAAVTALNDRYVPVLLDRAEWPDIAAAYAAASGRTDDDELLLYALAPDLELLQRLSPDAETLQAVADRWKNDRTAFLEEARRPVRRARAQLAVAAPHEAPVSPDLTALDRGTQHDILGGGFFRAEGRFDKDLADQARYAQLYLDAWRSSGNERFRDVARTTLESAIRDLQLPGGAFNASQQADSLTWMGRPVMLDGVYYLWDRGEVLHTFGPVIGTQLCDRFGLTAATDNLPRAVKIDPPGPALTAAIDKMLTIRLHRPMPLRDDAITESSASMVGALLRAGMLLDEPRYLAAAINGLLYIERTNSKALSRRRGVPATAADYAAVINAAIDVYEATLDPRWLDYALRLQAIPAATGNVPEPVRDFVPRSRPFAAADARLAAIGRGEGVLTRVVIHGVRGRPDTQQLLHAAFRIVDATRVIVWGGEPRKGESAAYAQICRPEGCSRPITDPAALK